MGESVAAARVQTPAPDTPQPANPRVVAVLEAAVPSFGATVVLIGGLALVGWALDVVALKSILPDLASMKANTALGLVLSGAALLWIAHPRLRAAVCVAAVVVVCLGLVTLVEYAGWEAGIDELLAEDPAGGPRATPPGRMSPLTAVCFVAYGGALLLKRPRRAPWAAQALALATAALAGMVLIGYLYALPGSSITSYTEMALHTAVAFELLALGFLCLDAQTALVAADCAGGATARRLLPVVVVAPVVLGFFMLMGQRAGRYGTETGLAIVVMAVILVLAAFVWHHARGLVCLDLAQQAGARALKVREERMRRVLDSSLDAVASTDIHGTVTFWNRAAETMFGWRREEAVGRNLADLVVPADRRGEHRRDIARLIDPSDPHHYGHVETRTTALRRDGSAFPIEVCVTAVHDDGALSFSAFMADLTEQEKARAALRHSEERHRQFFEENLAGAFVTRPDGTIVDCNPAFLRIFGFDSAEQALGTNAARLYPSPDGRREMLERLRRDKRLAAVDLELRRVSGEPVSVISNAVGTFDGRGELVEIKGYVVDNTERKRAEEQLRQAQRIDALGRLAGGVAHDFNNLLGVITGYDDLLLKHLPKGDVALRYATEIGRAAERAASLTRQLLAFSRKQLLQPRILDLNAVVGHMEQMLQRLIGEDIDMVVRAAPGLEHVKADPGQIEQLVMNLAVNARDAMPTGGRLTIETANVVLDHSYVERHPGARFGPHVMLAVTDTGRGMDAATQARIFEPFFTTKEPGRGTGLGLATVYGIVKQSGGSIWVYSEPGQGTTFKIYLPAVEQAVETAAPAPAPERTARRGSETILLVEDEEMLREVVREALAAEGYVVREARHAADALRLVEQDASPVDLLLTDTVMPGIGGRELAERMQALRPGVRVLYMSGYTDDTVVRHGVFAAEVNYLQKPFTLDTLAAKVRAALDGPAVAPAAAHVGVPS